jgi:hypothetical protein
MKNTKDIRILSIAPSTRGFGFAVIEGDDKLVDWGLKWVNGNKNVGSLKKVEEMMALYQPNVMVLQDVKDSRRVLRTQKLIQQIVALAKSRKVRVVLFSRKQLWKVFFHDGLGTKYALAELLAEWFPEELGDQLPPKRKPWMTEDYRMDIFDAVALGMALRLKK